MHGAIPDRLCFTNTQRPYVLPNHFRLTRHQRNQFRKLDGISLLLTQSDRPSQSINFLVLHLRCSLAKRSPAQGARNSTQILIQCLWLCKNYFSTHQPRAMAAIPKRQAGLCCRENQHLHLNSAGTFPAFQLLFSALRAFLVVTTLLWLVIRN